MQTTLCINHFSPENLQRRVELDECLAKNIANPDIDRIIVLATSDAEHRKLFVSQKLIWEEISKDKRPTFQQFFNALNRHTTSAEDLNIVANADVFFDDTLAKLKAFDLQGLCVALTRWEHKANGQLVVEKWDNSQDVWIFQGHIKPLGWCDFPMGFFGCDNRLAWELRRADYHVVNPCYDIITHHRHDSGIRNNGRNIGGNYEDVKRSNLIDCGFRSKQPIETGLIAFSLWGNDAKYSMGAIENSKIAKFIYPGWLCRFYIAEGTPASVWHRLNDHHAELVWMPKETLREALAWRFLACDDTAFARCLVRDCDSRFTYKERRAVDEWIDSGLPFHVMRDSPHHCEPIMGGMFGCVPGTVPMKCLLNEWKAGNPYGEYNWDQRFLGQSIWPRVSNRALVHDTFAASTANVRPFPKGYEHFRFVGERINEDNHHTHWDRNDYIRTRLKTGK